MDQSHIVVSQKGDGSSLSGSGFSYELLNKGSSLSIGSSAVLVSNAPKFTIPEKGADGVVLTLVRRLLRLQVQL